MLEVIDVHKRYGTVKANDGVAFTVQPGALHGLVGENGAGKSTIVGIVSGARRADAGRIRLDGVDLDMSGPRDGLAAGIGLLHQDPMVLGPMTVLENFLLGSHGHLSRAEGRRQLAATCDRLGFELPPDAVARTLTVGERQQLEMARLLAAGARVLILDEPTTAISADQRELLFAALRRLADEEGLSVVYVTHKLEELAELCHRVTVMRAGRVVGERDLPVSDAELVELMFGTSPELGEREAVTVGAPLLRLRGVGALDGSTTVADADLVVHAGEVVGLAGMEGSGQRSLLRLAAGVLAAEAGTIELADAGADSDELVDVTHESPRRRRAMGLEFLPADRLAEGLVPGLTVAEHADLAGAVPVRSGWRRFWRDDDAAVAVAERAIDTYRIKATPSSTPEQLSGGNQQRLLLSLVGDDVDVLLMEHPTRGLDVASAEWVWDLLTARADAGAGVVFSSSDLDELRRRADRILVCFAGRIIASLDAADADPDTLGHLIGGRE